MKIRVGFISNSSSASYILPATTGEYESCTQIALSMLGLVRDNAISELTQEAGMDLLARIIDEPELMDDKSFIKECLETYTDDKSQIKSVESEINYIFHIRRAQHRIIQQIEAGTARKDWNIAFHSCNYDTFIIRTESYFLIDTCNNEPFYEVLPIVANLSTDWNFLSRAEKEVIKELINEAPDHYAEGINSSISTLQFWWPEYDIICANPKTTSQYWCMKKKKVKDSTGDTVTSKETTCLGHLCSIPMITRNLCQSCDKKILKQARASMGTVIKLPLSVMARKINEMENKRRTRKRRIRTR